MAVPVSCQSEGALEVYVEPVMPSPHLVVIGRSPAVDALDDVARIATRVDRDRRGLPDLRQDEVRPNGAPVVPSFLSRIDNEQRQVMLTGRAHRVGRTLLSCFDHAVDRHGAPVVAHRDGVGSKAGPDALGVPVVSHDERVYKYGDRILSMEDGRLVKVQPQQACGI